MMKLMWAFVLLVVVIPGSTVIGHGDHAPHKQVIYPTPRSPSSLQMFPLNQVTLNPGSPSYDGQQLNAEYLHFLSAEQLLYNFWVNAGLNNTPPAGGIMGGWEAPTGAIRGHFVGMYMSASARAWLSYGDTIQKEKMEVMIPQLALCQQALGGYLSAFPSTTFDALEALQWPWAPYYVIHKIMQGLMDVYLYIGNQQAFDIILGMADYFIGRIENVIAKYTIYRWQEILTDEFGGMNDIMYQVYNITGNHSHLWMAQMFDMGAFLGPIVLGQDELTTLHANQHIPIVIGSARRYEVVGDPLGQTIAENFYEFVVGNRSYATGGHNGGNGTDFATDEHWGEPGMLAATLTNNNQEFCTTYNTLKLTIHLIQWSDNVKYMDFYERAYFNGILGNQNHDSGPGVMLYNYPLATGFSKGTSLSGWGDPMNSFWCCYGSGVEQWAKMGEAIYFRSVDDTQVYVSLFVASTLNWAMRNIIITQETTFPIQQGSSFVVNTGSSNPETFTLNIHIPYWVQAGAQVTLNGQPLKQPITPSSLFPISRDWNDGDTVNITLPMAFHFHYMPDDPSIAAVMYGPLVLGGLTNVTHSFPTNESSQLPSLIKPIPNQPLQFLASVNNGAVVMQMQPLYTIMDEHYGVYWKLFPSS